MSKFRCLASVHKYLRFCDLCKQLVFGAQCARLVKSLFIQLVRVQHVVPPVPGEPRALPLISPPLNLPRPNSNSNSNPLCLYRCRFTQSQVLIREPNSWAIEDEDEDEFEDDF